jgi:hypothetical protein
MDVGSQKQIKRGLNRCRRTVSGDTKPPGLQAFRLPGVCFKLSASVLHIPGASTDGKEHRRVEEFSDN